jgi:hypothetical protein
MAVSRAFRRLLRVLEIEEEQRRVEFAAGLGEVNRLNRALEAAGKRDRGGRLLVASSAFSGDASDRLAGLEETRTARRVEVALKPKIATAESLAATLRQEFLAKRTERRQAEVLVDKAEAREAAEAEKRSQRNIDDRFLSRFRGAEIRKPDRSPRGENAPPGTEEA